MPGKNNIDFTPLIGLSKKIGAILVALAVFNTIAVWYITRTDAYRDFEDLLEFQKEAKEIIIPKGDSTDKAQSREIIKLHNWVENKSKSFSVGLRVDENDRLLYKDRFGNLYTAYYLIVYKAFFYVDKDGFEHECH